LHGRASLASVGTAAGAADLSEVRFRSNIAIEGAQAWDEQAWIGRSLRIGDVRFKAVMPKARCLATHANPLTGERDLPLMRVLPEVFPDEKPVFAIAIVPESGGGQIRMGERVTLVE